MTEQEKLTPSTQRIIGTSEELGNLGIRATVVDPSGDVWTNDGDTLDPWGSLTHCDAVSSAPKWIGPADMDLPVVVVWNPYLDA